MPHTKINGASLYYQFDGPNDAPVVLLCNSLGTNLHMWDAQMPALSKTYRMLRYDSRGHGQSDVTPGPYTIEMLGQDAIGLLDALDIRRVLFCGLSLGGVIAQWLGIHGRDRLNAIVISNSAAKIGNDDFWNKRIEKLREGGIAPVAEAQVSRWFTAKYIAANPQVIEKMKQMFVGTSVDGYIATCEAIRDNDLRGSINHIQTPALVIAGTHDVVTPPADGKFMAVGIPGAQYAEMNASHLSNMEDASEFHLDSYRFLLASGGSLMDDRERHSAGMKVRREVLGAAHVDQAESREDAVHRAVSGFDYALRLGRNLGAARLASSDAESHYFGDDDRAESQRRISHARARRAEQ